MEISEVQIVYKGNTTSSLSVTSSEQAYNVLLSQWDLNKINHQEEMKMLLLNRANKVLGVYHISTGGMTATIVDIKLIMATAINSLASAIILAHNHPSESLIPSNQDKEITNKLKKACSIFDVMLLDHLIISKDSYYSFRDSEIL